jgi:hypothetical protein
VNTLGDLQEMKPNVRSKLPKRYPAVAWFSRKCSLFPNLRHTKETDRGPQITRKRSKLKFSWPQPVVEGPRQRVSRRTGTPSLPIKIGLPAHPKVFRDEAIRDNPSRLVPPAETKRKSSHNLRHLWDEYPGESLSKFFHIPSNAYRRRSSESSFACQGIVLSPRDEHYPFQRQGSQCLTRGLSRRGSKSVGTLKVGPVLAPQSSGPRNGPENRDAVNRGRSEKRDTSFYQHRDDLLREYHDRG